MTLIEFKDRARQVQGELDLAIMQHENNMEVCSAHLERARHQLAELDREVWLQTRTSGEV